MQCCQGSGEELYFSYVLSIISYGIIFWGNTGNGVKMFRTQKKF